MGWLGDHFKEMALDSIKAPLGDRWHLSKSTPWSKYKRDLVGQRNLRTSTQDQWEDLSVVHWREKVFSRSHLIPMRACKEHRCNLLCTSSYIKKHLSVSQTKTSSEYVIKFYRFLNTWLTRMSEQLLKIIFTAQVQRPLRPWIHLLVLPPRLSSEHIV